MACNWIYFPNNQRAPEKLRDVVAAFDQRMDLISSPDHTLSSNAVLESVSTGLAKAGFEVETSKKSDGLLRMPVLFRDRGEIEKSFYADAFHSELGIVIEVEAGRAVANNQFLKDFFEACMMLDANYLCIAVRNVYESGSTKSFDYERVTTFFKTLYASDRLRIPLKGVMIIGY